jgi:hypothetical protein
MSHEWGDETDPSAGYVAWLLWGGEPGRRSADSLKARLNKTAAESSPPRSPFPAKAGILCFARAIGCPLSRA